MDRERLSRIVAFSRYQSTLPTRVIAVHPADAKRMGLVPGGEFEGCRVITRRGVPEGSAEVWARGVNDPRPNAEEK